MCGRINLSQSPLVQALLAHFGLAADSYPAEPQWNIAPSDTVPVIARLEEQTTALLPMQWWLVPRWSKTAKPDFTMFNARSETAAKSKAFSAPLKRQRGIVPVHSFIEWQKNGAQKQAYGILDAHQAMQGQALAAIWECWQEQLYSFAILTQAADPDFQSIHTRMPIWLEEQHWDAWLDNSNKGEELLPELCGKRPALQLVPLNSSVNNASNKEKPKRLQHQNALDGPKSIELSANQGA